MLQKNIEPTLDAIYNERDRCVGLAAKLALELGYRTWLDSVTDPMPGFNHAVYIELPGVGQVSWHIRDDELPLFAFLPYGTGKFDKHTKGAKYDRIDAFCRTVRDGRKVPRG